MLFQGQKHKLKFWSGVTKWNKAMQYESNMTKTTQENYFEFALQAHSNVTKLQLSCCIV